MITLINRNGYYVRVRGIDTPQGKHGCFYVLNKISQVSGYSISELTSPNRETDLMEWRQIVEYICVTLRLTTLKNIGMVTGFRNHATVIHSFNSIQDKLDINDAQIVNKFSKVKHLIKQK